MTNTICLPQELEIPQSPQSNLQADAQELANQIGTILRSQFGCTVGDLRVTRSDEGLLLEGTVSSYHSKQLAQHVAKKMSGNMVVVNQINVRQAQQTLLIHNTREKHSK